MDASYIMYGFYVSVFLSALMLVHGLWQVYLERRLGAAVRRRRLRDNVDSHAGHVRQAGLRRESLAPPHETLVPALLLRRLSLALDRAGSRYSVHRALAGIAGLTFALILAAATLLALAGFAALGVWIVPALAVSVGLAGGIGLPAVYLRYLGTRRLARFTAQLPDALDVMVRSLRAGHPVAAAMSMVESDLPEPIAGEFGKTVDEMTYGLDLRQALGHLAERVDSEDLRFTVASVRLQHETGGNLAEVLQRLAELMRARTRLAQKIHSFAAEARLSARILAVMPLIFIGLVFWANPDIYGAAARDPLFLPVVLIAGGLQIVGILIMGRMARIRV